MLNATRHALAFGTAALAACLAACATPTPSHTHDRVLPYGEPPPLVIVKKPAEKSAATAPTTSAPTTPAPTPAPADTVAGAADPKGEMVVHLLDVGQGASTLVELPCGAVLIDTGGEQNEDFHSSEALREQLDAFFARRTDLKKTIDVLFVTHPHIDHVRGIPEVLDHYTVKNIVDNGLPGEANVRDQIQYARDFVASHNLGYRAIHRDAIDAKTAFTDAVVDPLKCVDIHVLSGAVDADPGWGENDYGKRHFENANNHSVVVRVDFGKSSLLVTGDLEEVAIHELVEKYRGTKWLDADVYEAGHHGSHNGTTSDLMQAVTPKVALIAMGPEDRHHQWTAWAYGHPREPTVKLLEEGVSMTRPAVEVPIGIKVKGFVSEKLAKAVYGTGWDGPVDVEMRADGKLVVHTHPKKTS